ELKRRALDGPLLPLIARLNAIRRENTALQWLGGRRLLENQNDQPIPYARPAGGDVLIVCVNLHPRAPRAGGSPRPAPRRPRSPPPSSSPARSSTGARAATSSASAPANRTSFAWRRDE